MIKYNLSLIVPMYNLEEHISRLIDSIHKINVNYADLFEILIINDGSIDNSVVVVEQLIQNSSFHFRLINKENGGHGSTINRGIQEAQGKYIKVIDGDDWVNPIDFEQVLVKLDSLDVDIVLTNYTTQYLYENRTETTTYSNQYPTNQILNIEIYQNTHMAPLFYKTELLKNANIKLSEKTFYTDMEFILFPVFYAKNFIYFDLDIYQYFVGRAGQSIQLSSYLKNYSHLVTIAKSVLLFQMNRKALGNIEQFKEKIIFYCVRNCLFMAYLQKDYKKECKAVLKILIENNYRFPLKKDKTFTLLFTDVKTNFIFDSLVRQTLVTKIENKFK